MTRTEQSTCRSALPALMTLCLLAPQASHAAQACGVHSPSGSAPVVELYTSEGCNSCPPADQWLSRLKADPEVVALAFHVDYWDRLGWKDRFASAEHTRRQTQQQSSSGAGFSYTPQVIVDGADRKDWHALMAPLARQAQAAAPVELSLQRDGDGFTAVVSARDGAPAKLAAYWAVTEQGHVSVVKAGENRGATLNHDYVVREYQPVTPWTSSADAPATLRFAPRAAADPSHPRQINLIVVSADSGRPLQAVKLGC